MSGDDLKVTPWKNGFYRMKGFPSMIFTVNGEIVTIENAGGRATNQDNDPNYNGTWKFGDFGEGLVYDLGNYVFIQNFINLCLIHLLVQKELVKFKTF